LSSFIFTTYTHQRKLLIPDNVHLIPSNKTMGLIREPKNVDFTIKSEPWTKEELKMFREIMKQQRERRAKLKSRLTKKRSKTV
jgi:hypothetical protein